MTTTTNPFKRLQGIIGEPPKSIAEVVSVNSDGTSLLQARGGQVFRARGSGHPVGAKVWVRGEDIISGAPDLPVYQLFI